jgi:F-type H+-transporting ATPase subunit delta
MSEPKEFHADVTAQRVAKVYAQALLDSATKAGDEERVMEELDSLVDDVYKSQPELEVLLSGAATGRESRRALIEKAFTPRCSATFSNFLQVLNGHDRLELLRTIRHSLHSLYNAKHRRIRVHLTSVLPLNDEQKSLISAAIAEKFQMEPILETALDPSILGGLKIRVGALQIDATVRTRIDNIRQQLLTRSSHEIQARRDHYCTD